MALAPRINGQYYLGALANFLQNSGDANVLSTPNLMTLDNEEAKIVIGNNVPFVTGSYANTGGNSGAVNPFNTVERKDVGLMLRVRPQISENGTVKMAIYQEVSKIDAATLKDTNGPTTSKRSIESNVLVDDGSIIVLGGLLEDSYSQAEDKVPVMGDIPVVLGNLFRSENRSRKKTNLMVFLRPVVVRDSMTSDALMLDRYEAIRALQQWCSLTTSCVMRSVSGRRCCHRWSPAQCQQRQSLHCSLPLFRTGTAARAHAATNGCACGPCGTNTCRGGIAARSGSGTMEPAPACQGTAALLFRERWHFCHAQHDARPLPYALCRRTAAHPRAAGQAADARLEAARPLRLARPLR
jgi:hypothetical protein